MHDGELFSTNDKNRVGTCLSLLVHKKFVDKVQLPF